MSREAEILAKIREIHTAVVKDVPASDTLVAAAKRVVDTRYSAADREALDDAIGDLATVLEGTK